MEARSSVFDLARKLLQLGDPARLDEPLESLSGRMTDPVAQESLIDLVKAGLAHSLRDALEHDRLDRFAAESCTQREEAALCHTLQLLLGNGLGQHGDDDLARLSKVAAPVWERGPLRTWATEHNVARLLEFSASEALQGAEAADGQTIEACVLGEAHPHSLGPSLLALPRVNEEARSWLLQRASWRAGLRARELLWQGRPAAELSTLHGRLVTLLQRLSTAEHSARFVPASPVQIEHATGVSRAHLRMPSEDEPCEVRLFLSGHEQRGLVGLCQRCGEGTCCHVRALGARLLDALHERDDRLHEPLKALARRPSWQRFIDQLGDEGAVPETSAEGVVSFRVSLRGERATVTAYLQRPMRNGRRAPGKAVPASRALRLSAVTDRDRPVLEAMLNGGRPLSTQSVPADLHVLRALCEHPRVYLTEGGELIRIAEAELQVEFVTQGDGVLPQVRVADRTLEPRKPAADQQAFLVHARSSSTLHFCAISAPARRLLSALETFRGVLPKESFEALGPFVSGLRRVARVQVPPELEAKEYPADRRLLLRLSLSVGDALHAALSSRPLPMGALWNPGHGPEVVVGLHEGKSVLTRRELTWERETALALIGQLGLDQHIELEPYLYRIEDEMAALSLLKAASTLGEVLEVEWSEMARRFSLQGTVTTSDLHVRLWKRGHWLEIEGHALLHDTQVAVERLLEAAKRGERFVKVSGDTYAEIEEALLHKLQQAQALVLADKAPPRFHALGAGLLSRFPELTPGDATTAAWLQRAACGPQTGSARELPAGFEADVRTYQAEGIAFLRSLSEWAPGACLADDMGLGKTVQAIALLCARSALGPSLVVAPTSVVSNFCSELKRFAPGLRGREYRGEGRRGLLTCLAPGDVLLVSYDILLRDVEAFSGHRFGTLVIDEAQWIKNARTARARAVRAVEADFRLALSGTPVENRLGDLWSLFHVIVPGLLGSWARFRSLFAVPIERYEDRERLQLLRNLIAPFLLRREKRDVEPELPARTEVIHRVELSKPERELYLAAATRARENLKRRKKHDEARATTVLADLTRLRQLACHPRLVLERDDVESSKMHALLGLLTDLLPRGHRALVFSQFVRHLGLLQAELDARHIPYLYMDGSTPAEERPQRVKSFQTGDAPLFLISLKAGGTGLNLTAADYVFHLDPWWNPASEDQASDRAHRLGQNKPVTIVKLVAAGTIEERVQALHEQKRELASGLLDDRGSPVPFDLKTLESLVETETHAESS